MVSAVTSYLSSLCLGLKGLRVSKIRLFPLLPERLIGQIGSYLPEGDKYNFAKTCQRMRQNLNPMFFSDGVSASSVVRKKGCVLPAHFEGISHSLVFLDLANCSNLNAEKCQKLFKQLRSLTTLDLSSTNANDEVLDVLSQSALQTQLTELRLARCVAFSATMLKSLTGFTALRVLDLSFTNVNDEVLDAFAESDLKTQLTGLRLFGCRDVSAVKLRVLAGFTALRVLDLSQTEASDEVLEAMEQSTIKTQLAELRLFGCRDVSAVKLQVLAGFTALRVLDLSNTNATDEVLKAMEQSALKTRLAELKLSVCIALSATQLKRLANFTALRVLDISFTKASDEVLEAMKQSVLKTQLTVLRLSECDASAAKLKILTSFTALRMLDISFTKDLYVPHARDEVRKAFKQSAARIIM